jgi:hypothetical protein
MCVMIKLRSKFILCRILDSTINAMIFAELSDLCTRPIGGEHQNVFAAALASLCGAFG